MSCKLYLFAVAPLPCSSKSRSEFRFIIVLGMLSSTSSEMKSSSGSATFCRLPQWAFKFRWIKWSVNCACLVNIPRALSKEWVSDDIKCHQWQLWSRVGYLFKLFRTRRTSGKRGHWTLFWSQSSCQRVFYSYIHHTFCWISTTDWYLYRVIYIFHPRGGSMWERLECILFKIPENG